MRGKTTGLCNGTKAAAIPAWAGPPAAPDGPTSVPAARVTTLRVGIGGPFAVSHCPPSEAATAAAATSRRHRVAVTQLRGPGHRSHCQRVADAGRLIGMAKAGRPPLSMRLLPVVGTKKARREQEEEDEGVEEKGGVGVGNSVGLVADGCTTAGQSRPITSPRPQVKYIEVATGPAYKASELNTWDRATWMIMRVRKSMDNVLPWK